MRRTLAIALLGTAALDALVGGGSVLLAGVLTLDPARGWVPGLMRGLFVFALAAGGPVIASLLALGGAGALAGRSPAGPWLALIVGVLHLGVPLLGLFVVGASIAMLRDEGAP